MLVKRVRSFVAEHALLAPGQALVVAVSGGADSLALLLSLRALRAFYELRLHVAHLDHMIRGQEAEADAEFVRRLAADLGLPSTIGRRDVPAYRRQRHLSPEDAAREVRYRFLADVAAEVGADSIAVGHTMDDQVESVLLHLIRGAGLTGLAGMKPSIRLPVEGRDLEVIRPLLGVTRRDTAAFCVEQGVVAREDSTNRQLSLPRNRIRTQLVPLLTDMNPHIRQVVAGLAVTVSDDLAFLDAETDRAWPSVARTEDAKVILDTAALRARPAALQRRILRKAIAVLRGGLTDVALAHVEAMLDVLAKGAGRCVDLPGGLHFRVEYDRAFLGCDQGGRSETAPIEGVHPLVVPGETTAGPWRVRAVVSESAPEARCQDAVFAAELDLDRVGKDLVVRSRRQGERFRPLGMSESKKLQDFMVDEKIPRHQRSSVPIVASAEGPVWMVGWRIDDRAKVTPATRRWLQIEFRPTKEADGDAG